MTDGLLLPKLGHAIRKCEVVLFTHLFIFLGATKMECKMNEYQLLYFLTSFVYGKFKLLYTYHNSMSKGAELKSIETVGTHLLALLKQISNTYLSSASTSQK